MIDRTAFGVERDAGQRPAEMRDPHRARLRRQDFGEPRGVEMIGIVQRTGELAFAGALRRALRFGDAVLDRHRLGERPPRRLILEQPISDEAVRSEEHTSELQSLMRISYAVFCLKKKKKQNSSI